MEKEIFKYLSKYIPITKELEEELSKIEFIKRFGNGTILLEEGKISNAALDVFENEPNPEINLLMNPNISLTPHIGAATQEAQDRIGEELATQIIEILA